MGPQIRTVLTFGCSPSGLPSFLALGSPSTPFLSAILRTVVRFPGQGTPFLLPWLGLA